jgi:hypothetical protein
LIDYIKKYILETFFVTMILDVNKQQIYQSIDFYKKNVIFSGKNTIILYKIIGNIIIRKNLVYFKILCK